MPNGTYGGVRGRKTKVGRKLLRFPPTRLMPENTQTGSCSNNQPVFSGALQPIFQIGSLFGGRHYIIFLDELIVYTSGVVERGDSASILVEIFPSEVFQFHSSFFERVYVGVYISQLRHVFGAVEFAASYF